MERGDLSTALPRRFLITWEEAIARLPRRRERAYRFWLAFNRWEHVLEQWETEPHAVHVLSDLAFRMGYQFDVVTHLGGDAYGNGLVRALEARLEVDNVPAHRVQAMSRDSMQQHVVHRPDVISVVHGGPVFAYGARGIHVEDPLALSRLA